MIICQEHRSRYNYSGFSRTRFCPTFLVDSLIITNSRKIVFCRSSLDYKLVTEQYFMLLGM